MTEDDNNPNEYTTAREQLEMICDSTEEPHEVKKTENPTDKAWALSKALEDTSEKFKARQLEKAARRHAKGFYHSDNLINDPETKKLAEAQSKIEKKAHKIPLKIPLNTQMRIEKASEEELYFKRGDIALKDYHWHIAEIDKVAKDEFNVEFHNYLTLTRRADALDEMRKEKIRKDAEAAKVRLHPDPSLTLPASHKFPTAEEIGEIVNERIKKALNAAQKDATENTKYAAQIASHDREIKRLQKRIDEKTPERKAAERRLHRKSRKSQGFFNIQQLFRFPLTQGIVEKLYEVDHAISEFLLDLGKAEYVITKENIVSTTARRLMRVRAIDEPEMIVVDGQIKNRWVDILDRIENPRKYNKG